MNDVAKDSAAPDLDTLIRQAEMAVVESDRRWQRHLQAFGPALRESTGKAAVVGAIGLGAATVAWLVVRRLTRGTTTAAPAVHRQPPRRAAAPFPRSTGWRRATELGGALVGSALRSGLAPGHGRGTVPLLLSAALPWLTRWWRAQTNAQEGTPAREQTRSRVRS